MKKKKNKQADAVVTDAEIVVTTEVVETADSVETTETIETAASVETTESVVTPEVTSENPTETPVEVEAAPVAVALITDRKEIVQVLESIIFASPKAMSLLRLRNLLNSFQYDSAQLSEALEEMIEASAERGFQLQKVAGGYQYRTHPKNADVLQKLLEDKPTRLSGSALEVLTIVAYKQPLTRTEIDTIRGVDSGHLVKGLLEKNLVRTAGHAETVGRPLLYQTTPYFLEVFSLASLDDLPAIEEFNRELAEGQSDGPEGQMDVFSADPGFFDRDSPLAANPDRGAFDQKAEEVADMPDFGLEDRAREEQASS